MIGSVWEGGIANVMLSPRTTSPSPIEPGEGLG
jgi:hypothetical protein